MKTDVRRLWWRKMMIAAVLLVLGGMMNAAWAQTYTYKVVDADGNEVAIATSTSSTLGLPAEIKAVSCRYRFYSTKGEAQAMSASNEISTLPGSDATIYVGYRYSMRIFPNADNGQYWYIPQGNGEQYNGLGYDTGTGKFIKGDITTSSGDEYKWQFGGNPFKATLRWKSDPTKYLHYDADNGFELSTTPSYFMILVSTNNSNHYYFRLNDEVNETKNYINRNPSGSNLNLTLSASSPSNFGLFKGDSYMPYFSLYDTYGNFIARRADTGWRGDTYSNNPNTHFSGRNNYFDQLANRFETREQSAFYATNPQTDPNAVLLERIPHSSDPVMYMKTTPRLKNEGVPGVFTSTVIPTGSCQDLDLTGATAYRLKFTGYATTRYLYNSGDEYARYVDETTASEGQGAKWLLLGGDPGHIIIKSVVDGRVVSLPNLVITNTINSCSVTGDGEGQVKLMALDETTYPNNEKQCFALITYPDGANSIDYLVAQGTCNYPVALDARQNSGNTNLTAGYMRATAFRANNNAGYWDKGEAVEKTVVFEEVPVTIEYHIVNATTHEVVETVDGGTFSVGTTLSLPDRTRLERIGCTLSTKYYTDATCTAEVTTQQAGVTHYYIPYTVDSDALLNTYHIVFSTESDPVWHNVMVNNNKRIVFYNSTNSELPTSAYGPTELVNAETQWAFIGDPYSVKIINRANPSKAATVANGNNGTKVYLQDYDADHSRWCMRVGTTAGSLQLKVQGWGNDDYSAYWNAAGGSGSIQLYSKNEKYYSGSDNNIYVASPPTQLYYIPNHQDGVIAVAEWGNVNADGTFDLPAEIKSPLIPSNANYKFFKTEAQARAWTLNPTDENATAQGAITNKNQLDAADSPVYVGYKYVAAESELDLTGTTWYEMYYQVNATTNRYGQQHPSTATSTYTTTSVNESELSRFLWKLDGSDGSTSLPDPYGFRLVNKAADAALSFPTRSDEPWIIDGNFTSAVSRFFIRKVNGKWCIGATGISTSSTIYSQLGMRSYIFWIYMNENNKAIRIARNHNTQNPYTPGINGDSRAAAYLNFQEMDVADFTFHVPTRISGTDLTWINSINNYSSSDIALPAELERKYISSVSFYSSYDSSVANYDDRFSNPITTYSQAKDAGGNIYVKYTVDTANLPFTISTDYAHATWYRIKVVEGDVYAHLSETAQVAGSDDTYTLDYQYAFFGDPYELKVANRAGGEGNFLGVPAGSTSQEPIMPIANGTALNTWEIQPQSEAPTVETAADFRLRVFNTATAATPMYCGFYNGKACYFTSAITMAVSSLPEHKYTYHIIDNTGREAIHATVTQEVTTSITFENLPTSIASPYIADETITGYATATATTVTPSPYSPAYGRYIYELSDGITELPIPTAEELAKAEAEKTPVDVYIRYTTTHLLEKALRLNGKRSYNVQQASSSDYVYATAADATDKNASATDEQKKTQEYVWSLVGNDPYAVQLQNTKYKSYYKVTVTGTPPDIDFEASLDEAGTNTFFVLLAGSDAGNANRVKLALAIAGESTNGEELVFSTSALPSPTYHIVDKQHKVVISATSDAPDLEVPAAISSPLVSQYHFYRLQNFSATEAGASDPGSAYPAPLDADATYFPRTDATELTSIADALSGGDIHIYCTYDVGTSIKFDTTDDDAIDDNASMYMLRYLYGEEFYQEDGSDGVMTTKRKAVYPYSNGDANLYVYGQERWELQLQSGATTRTRWPWFIVSPLSDPYHVKIMSRQSQGKSTSHNYLYTHVVNYGGANHVVTGVTTRGDRVYHPSDKFTASKIDSLNTNYGNHEEQATEYMVLGTAGKNKLVTVGELEGEGIANDATYGKHRVVNSFEQYWKTYDTAKKKVLNISAADNSSDPATVPEGYRSTLENLGWHRYDAWANAKQWNGYNSITNKTSKDYEYQEHWFQTIDMGDGSFDFQEISLTAVLVLLDQHGWEVARLNLPNGPDDPTRAAKYAELKKYSSPMVERYHYWKTGSKVPGYHKFEVSDYAVDAYGNEYTTPVLGFLDREDGRLPNYELQGKVGNQSRDWYVTYDVKEEYANSYKGAATQAATQASAFLVKQGNGETTKYAHTDDGLTVTAQAAPANYDAITSGYLWYLRPNFNIDTEMGYNYSGIYDEKTKAETDLENYNAGLNGFDPYNLQIQSAYNPLRYMTVNRTDATLSNIWTGTGGTGALSLAAAQTAFNATGFDQTILNVTNQTFMVVDDGNGNMRLMPRFDNSHVLQGLSSLAEQAAAATANDQVGTQTLLLAKPTAYTYHVINKNGREAITYTDKYMASTAYTPSLPDKLKAYAAKNFRYFPLSEFYSEPLARNIYRLVNSSAASYSNITAVGNTADIYVVYDVEVNKIAARGFDGLKTYNLKLRNTASPVADNYLSYNTADGTVTATLTSLDASQKKTPENIWRIQATDGDPYQAALYSSRNHDVPLGVSAYGDSPATAGTETYQTFIITQWDTLNYKFELLAANSGTTDNIYAYLTYSDGPKVLRSADRQHNATVASNLVGFTLEPVTLAFTYKLYDLAGNLTLQGTVNDVSDMTPSLPDFMRSPLVPDDGYSYWQDETRSTPLTLLSATVNNTIHVSYVPLMPEEAALKLDGSEKYTLHAKNRPEILFSPTSPVSVPTIVGRRENFYEWTLLGRYIDGHYDPYDIAIYNASQNRYWNGNVQNNNDNDKYADINCNGTTGAKRFMILTGKRDANHQYIEIQQKKVNGSTYYSDNMGHYQYLYLNPEIGALRSGQSEKHVHLADGDDGKAESQFLFQPTHIYHVLNMQGKEAVTGVETRLVMPSATEPLLPVVIQSPLVKTYHYYDITAFDVSSDGTYTLKSGAKELKYVSDATTSDIYVVYTRADLDKNFDLNGSTVYNIIFGPDPFTQDGITETLNSYFGYEAGLEYRNQNKEDNAETYKFQVNGSYYADPSSGAMASRYIVVNSEEAKTSAIAAHAESGSDESRWDPKYLVEPALTDDKKQTNPWLWSFTGSDPYALQIHSMTAPDKYIYRNGESGGYTMGLTLGTTTNEQRRTYMLVGRGTGDDTRFNLMSSGLCTSGIAPYSYQYIGRSYHSNVHRTTRRGVVLQGFHAWGWDYTYNEALVTVKIVPQLESYVTYIVLNKQGNEAIRMKVKQSRGIKPVIPNAIRSPYATNFQYWDDPTAREDANKVTATELNATIYVTYDADEEALDEASLDLAGRGTGDGDTYNIWVNGMYLYNSEGTLMAETSPSKYDDTAHEWYLEGKASGSVDPYDVRLRSKQTITQYIELASYNNDNEANALSLIADNGTNDVQSFILMDGQPGRMELLAATGSQTIVSDNNRLAYLGYTVATQLLGVGSNDAEPKYQSGMSYVQVMLRRPLSGVTYHIMNLNGLEAVQYTVSGTKGDDLAVPEEIRSPFATNWQYWSDAACTVALDEVPSSNADIYVTYTYDDNTLEQLQLDGSRFYNMQVNGNFITESEGAINVLEDAELTGGASNINANLWAFNGQTASKGIDPYGLHLVNKAYSDVYAGAPLSYANDTEATMQMSDGETENFRSTFFLVGSSAEGPYEMVLASGPNITDNVLACVTRHDDEAINLNRDEDYQHGNSAMQIQMSSPVNQYLYKVYDRSGNLAIQAWGDGVAGAAPEIPAVIKSPLVSQFYYDMETLPYTTGTDEVRVTYDFDTDKLLAPNLLGTKAYNLKLRGSYFIKTSSGADVTVENSSADNLGTPDTDVAIWKPTGLFGSGEDIDPYCLTLTHSNGKVLTASAIDPGNNNMALENDNTANTYQRFILLESTDGSYEFMAATGDKIGSIYGEEGYDQFAYLAITEDNAPTLGRGEAYSRGKTAIQVELVPFQYTYTYIVINNDMTEAIRYTANQDGGDPILVPWPIRSPLIEDDEYKYYLSESFSTIGNWSTQFVFDDTEKKEESTLPYATNTIYVRYDYTPKVGGLDLSGTVKYQITHNNEGTVNYMFYDRSVTKSTVQNNSNAATNHTTSQYQWKLVAGNDPYNVTIQSQFLSKEASTNTPMTSPIGYLTDFCPWLYGNHTYEVWTENDVDTYTNDNATTQADFRAYRCNRFAIVGHEDGSYRLMTLVPHEKRISDDNTYYFITGGTGTWYKSSYNAPNASNGLSIQFLPVTTHNYRFHLTTKIDERKLEVEKPKTMARDLFEIPEELLRKYCDYTVTYYVINDDNDAERRPVEKGTEGAVEKNLDVNSGTELFPYFQYIDNLSDAVKENTWVDIYIDYKVKTHFMRDPADPTGQTLLVDNEGNYVVDPDGIPFNRMGWDRETTRMLLDNKQYAEALFQISTYDQLMEVVGTKKRLPRKDYLYFMVLKTDNDYTNSNGQYFLRREDNGRLSWLNNDYRIYKDKTKNYKQWPYSRCAEAYRDNDHSVFEEKNWLFCFAGDPYDLYIFNANSVVEETYNSITEQKEFVKTHRDHLVSYTTLTSTSGSTTEYAVNTPPYTETAPVHYRWGLANGQGTNSDKTFSLVTSEYTDSIPASSIYRAPTVPAIDSKPLYWRMDKSNVDKANEVMLQTRATDNTTPDYNLQVLPYEPTKFENVRFVLKRDDEIGTTSDGKASGTYLGNYPVAVQDSIDAGLITGLAIATKQQAWSQFIDALPSGTVRMYSSADDRMYVQGDVITVDDLPLELQRKFCDYKLYEDDYRNEGTITLPYCPVRGTMLTDDEGNIVYNSVGKAMYNYYAVNPTTGETIMVGPPGAQVPQGSAPMTIYFKYSVTTDKFLKQRPTTAEVQDMLANNDHVYFMDFADPKMLNGSEPAYDTGHHAYFDETATFKDQIGQVHGEVLAEKMRWNGSEFVYDTSQQFNYCQYKSTENRMESTPENLKWYFVGDPYKLQVYCTQYALLNDEPEGNLCRFDPTESSFQFVVDCVHFRTPDESFIDERKTLIYTDAKGNEIEVDNNNYGKPYYSDFYWEVVPAASEDPETFALRFRADNQLLGYRDVFYYLAHDGIKRTYREAQSENPKAYAINLSYDEFNAIQQYGKYQGYHYANDENCVIRLKQPTKVYFTVYKDAHVGDPVVKEELSEYFGLGETLTEVPRHLQRKYVKYGDLEYQKNNNSAWNSGSFPFTLANEVAYDLQNCKEVDPVHTIANGWVYQEGTKYDANGDPVIYTKAEAEAAGNASLEGKFKLEEDNDYTKCRASFKFCVTYEVDDITKDDIHLFTTLAEFTNASMEPQWLDVNVAGTWLYYDKTHLDGEGNENDTTHITNYPTNTDVSGTLPSGWDIGIKGLHWAFIGDPYKFTIINRRRWEDNGSPRTVVDNSNFWVGTGYAQNATQEKVDDVSQNVWYNYTKLGDTNVNRAYGEDGTGGNVDNGNTEWSLMMCKTGGAGDYFIRTASPKLESVDEELVGDYTNSDPRNMTNDYARIIRKDFSKLNETDTKSSYVLETFSLSTKTKDIQKATIRTAVAEDDDNADNDCFDANVRIYNRNGELKAALKHVEVTYGDVYKSLPDMLRRYGCNYVECYQIKYPSYSQAMVNAPTSSDATARTTEINTLVQNLNNFTGDNLHALATFNDETLSKDMVIIDLNGRKYYEIAYVYEVEEDAAQFFTSQDNAQQDDYYWSNAYYQWEQIYKGTNVRIVTYEPVFDHYEYNADGHIVNEVYTQREKVEYKSGEEIATDAYGWINSHTGSTQAFADERSQTEDDRQKWSLVGDPYDFEFKNYAEYLNNSKSALTYDEDDGIVFSTTEKGHWAIVQGLPKTTVVNGKTVNVYTDASGNIVYTAKTNGVANTPVYTYYLALIDDDETSPTYGMAIHFVTFDRAADNKDLDSELQYLKLKGAASPNDPTGNLFNEETATVKPFYLKDLMSYANWVVYHLVIAHQHSLDYIDTFEQLAGVKEKNFAKETIDRHLLEYLKYKYPAAMNTAKTDLKSDYLTTATLDANGDTIKTEGVYTAIKDRLTTAATSDETIKTLLKQASLRDVVTDSISDYSVKNVGIGNTLTVPWYMKRQFCNYTLYQRDVLRSVTSDRIVYEADGVTPKTFIDENGVEQIAKEIDWESVTESPDARGYAAVVAQNGKVIKKLDDSHRNRMVIIDVVYTVNPEEFRFADKGRNTTAWYSMLTQNDNDGLMNFSYKDGIGARHGREAHYTNNYLWAPEGDPYGFVMHNRYATINGTGWNNVVVSTTGQLPTIQTIKDGSLKKDSINKVTINGSYAADVVTPTDNAVDAATYTGAVSDVRFKDQRIIHYGRQETPEEIRTWAARNAVYEMFAGNWTNSFVMHPTSAYIEQTGDAFSSFYMVHNLSDHTAELKYYANASDIRSDKDANWRMITTPEQLLPYFERAGYVGGLQPAIANQFENIELYNQLQDFKKTYRTDASVLTDNFTTIDRARELVYGGKFYKRGGSGNPYSSELLYTDARPTSNDDLPLKFVSNNLVPLQKGYYRIQAFSRKALDADGANLDGTGTVGIQGPRYISGYRHKSEMDYRGYEDDDSNDATPKQLVSGSRWLHFIETDEEHTTHSTFEDLNAKIRSLEGSSHYERDIEPHPAMRGNIPILPAEYDPSSIFYFTPTNDSYDRYYIGTQGLRLRGRAGGKQGVDATYGVTKLVETSAEAESGYDDDFRLNDIGGTAITMRLNKYNIGDTKEGTSTVLTGWDDIVAENLKTHYLCIDANHRYRITIHKDNELKEIGDSYGTTSAEYWDIADINYGIQDTKWLLQPVGIQTQWPYNQMPLRVSVNKGGQKPDTSTGLGNGTEDNNYYASLYVPFDTRLSSTTADAAFTNIKESPQPKALQLTSVSQLNNMGNPQFIPAGWPVVIRTSKPITTITKEDGTTMTSAPHVDLYLPNIEPTSIPESFAKINLYGEYLEKTLTTAMIDAKTNDASKNEGIRRTIDAADQNIMVLGMPFVEDPVINNKEDWSNTSGEKRSLDYYAYNKDGAVGFYTNENWHRGYWTDGSEVSETASALTAKAFDALTYLQKSEKVQSHWATARNATYQQRSNKYVYNNKAYYVHNSTSGETPAKPRLVIYFDDEPEEELDTPEEPDEPDLFEQDNTEPWPCDVYDLQGRRVARNETPENLRRNHPGLPKGVYIFGHKKVIVK